MTHPGRASSSSLSESRRSHSTRSASYWWRLYAPATPGIMWPSTDSATSPGQPIAASSAFTSNRKGWAAGALEGYAASCAGCRAVTAASDLP